MASATHVSRRRSPANETFLGSWKAAILLIAGLALSPATATDCLGQDMRVYTTVRNIDGNPQNSPILAESLTLFHAGKVYDYMENVGEVVIFEPMQHRFTILGPDYLATKISFDEVRQFLKAASIEAEQLMANPDDDNRSRRLAASIRCQFHPQFKITPQTNRFLLESECLSYDVTTSSPPDEATWKVYLDYADWAARLNYILHPQSLFPEPRLAVNQTLREHHQLPVQVDLSARLDRQVRLRAQHKFGWELQPVDRQYIDQWERRRESESIRWVSVHEYQKKLLAKSTSR